jgi:hypothetical protein
MSKFTDSDFGFSFWYPTVWSVVSAQDQVQLPGPYPGGHLLKGIVLKGNQPTPYAQDITVQEIYSPTLSLTDVAAPADPVGVSFKYFFDTDAQRWMVAYPFDEYGPNGVPLATSTADISVKTIGDLYMFQGAARFGADTIVPLSAQLFIVVSADNTNVYDQRLLAKTIVPIYSSGGSLPPLSEQQAMIEAEKNAYLSTGAR